MDAPSITKNRLIVSRKEWLVARRVLLAREKAATRLRDSINFDRQALPWVRVEQNYVFETNAGRKSLADLFAGRSQLMVYHFMMGPDWTAGCPGCSFLADHLDGALPHLGHHDVTLVAVSRAPLTKINAYKARMGWRFPWVSSFGSDFNFDYHVSFTKEDLAKGSVDYNFTEIDSSRANDELPGLSAFFKDEQGTVFHTYSAYARGDEELIGTLMILDRAPKGRNETTTMDFVRRHDEYDDDVGAHDCCGSPQAAGIGKILRAYVDRGEVAGAVALTARQGTVRVDAAGVRDLTAAIPMRRDTLFRIASMTKPITAAAAMILVEEGRIALDDTVDRWLPELANRRVLRSMGAALDDTEPARRPITLDDLLTFRLGLGVIMAPAGRYPLQAAMADLGVAPGPQELPFGPDEFMARIGRLPLMHQPGAGWMYHTGADILAVLIARISGMTLETFLQERIFAPLAMRDTGFTVPPTALGRLASCYALDDDRTLRAWEPAREGADVTSPAFPNALVSTVDNYLAFARILLDEGHGPHQRIMTRDSVRLMMTDHITQAQKAISPFFPGFWETHGWGFGGAVTTGGGPGRPGSYGWAGGFGTTVLVDPDTRMTTIVMTQRLMRGPDDATLHQEVQRFVYQALDA
jgi:predicted dithiol-disulfide oxidoreductase (DUF899 family)